MVSEEKMMVHGKEGYRKSPGDDLKIIAILNEALLQIDCSRYSHIFLES